jgi:hypothetical protein
MCMNGIETVSSAWTRPLNIDIELPPTQQILHEVNQQMNRNLIQRG